MSDKDKLTPLGEQVLIQSTAKFDKDSSPGFIILTNLRVLWTKDQVKRHVNIPLSDIESTRSFAL